MRLRRLAIFALRTALSSMMTAWSRTSAASLSATSMTNSEQPTRAFATLRFAGDALDPDEISCVLDQQPTRAYRKGERYRPGPRSPEVTATADRPTTATVVSCIHDTQVSVKQATGEPAPGPAGMPEWLGATSTMVLTGLGWRLSQQAAVVNADREIACAGIAS